GGPGANGNRRGLASGLPTLPTGGPRRPAQLPAQDGERRWLGGHPPGLAGAVPRGRAAALLPARLVEHPEPGQTERGLRGAVGEGLGRLPRAPDRRSFAQRLRRLWGWAQGQELTAWLREQVQKLCARAKEYGPAYRHPGGHRTSNMLDRLMRSMNRYF